MTIKVHSQLILILSFTILTPAFSKIIWPFSSHFQQTSVPPTQSPHEIENPLQSNTSQPEEISSVLKEGFVSQEHPFGAKYFKRNLPTGTESIVHLPSEGLFNDPSHYKDLYDSLLLRQNNKEHYEQKAKDVFASCGASHKNDFFKIAPIFVGTLTPKNSSFSWEAPCFKSTRISLDIVDDSTVQIIHENKNATGLMCSDAYFYSMYTNFHVELFATSGTHKITLKVKPQQLKEIMTVGIQMFRICDQATSFIPDLFKTLWLFLGGFGLNPHIPFFGSKPTSFEVEQNVKFMEEVMEIKWEKRPQDVVVDLDESLIKSGDFLAIIRFDGLDPIIGYGSGSLVGHSAMALRVNGELFVVESQSGWYWPREGIQMNPYKQWVVWARNAGFHVTWLPLRKEYSEKFDEKAAYDAFKKLEGTPYGFHNFLFGWIDTPDHSCPPLLSPEFLGAAFSIVERLSPKAARSVFTLALNRRLGTENLTVAEIAVEAANRGLTLPDLYAMVEQDSWKYEDGYSLVCSSFVVAMYKAAGLFGKYQVNAVEFTPRDLYQLEFIDPNPSVPENCKQFDPTNPYCQIMGKYRMIFPGIGTVSPYDHMNENCWSEGPDFVRYPQNC